MTTCLVCPVLFPGCNPRDPDHPLVCTPCRRRLAADLRDIADLYALLPVVLVPGRRADGPRVSGSRQPPVPPDLDVLDLLLSPRQGSMAVRYRHDPHAELAAMDWASIPGGDPDQVGVLSVSTVLDFWVHDWRSARDVGEGLPDPLVSTMVAWLSGMRLRWACDQHPAVDEFASDVNRLAYAVRAALDLNRYVEWERRTGKTVLPFELEEDLRAAFGDDPSEAG